MDDLTRRDFLRNSLSGAAVLAGAGVLFPLLSGCSRGWKGRDRARFRKTILLGFDGFDPRLVREFIDAGLMPNFGRLADAGGFAPLGSSLPPMSPIAWSNMSTGCNPGQHGIFDFIHREVEQYRLFVSMRKPINTLRGTQYVPARARDGFWRIASDAGVPTVIIRYPITFPAERVNGRMLSGLGVPDLVGQEGSQMLFVSPDPRMSTEIEGPVTGKDTRANVPLSARVTSPTTAEVHVGDASAFSIHLNEWSPWVPLKFKAGLRTLHGMVKFLLTETSPELKIYATPVNIHPQAPVFPITYPESYGRELVDAIGLFYTLGLPETMDPIRLGWFSCDEFLKQIEEIDRERLAMLEFELGRFREGLFAFVFDACDRVQHAFWFTRDTAHPGYTPEKAAQYKDVIPETYRKMDAALGRVLEKVDDETAILVCSDHGFDTYRRSFHVNRWLVENGFASLIESTEHGGKGLLRDMDWARTQAYAVGFTSIYLNLAGRERQGIVSPGPEAEHLLQRITAQLEQLTDPDSGEKVVHAVYPASRLYRGPQTQHGPDLVLGLNPGWRTSFQTALGGVPVRLFDDNNSAWTGDHLYDPQLLPGIILTNRPIRKANPRGEDIAATILDCLGIEPPPYMDGRPLI